MRTDERTACNEQTKPYDEWKDWIGTLRVGMRYTRPVPFRRSSKDVKRKWLLGESEHWGHSRDDVEAQGLEVIEVVDLAQTTRHGLQAIYRRWMEDPDGTIVKGKRKALRLREDSRMRGALNQMHFKAADPAGEVVVLWSERERRRSG